MLGVVRAEANGGVARMICGAGGAQARTSSRRAGRLSWWRGWVASLARRLLSRLTRGGR